MKKRQSTSMSAMYFFIYDWKENEYPFYLGKKHK